MKKSGKADRRPKDADWTYVGPEEKDVITWDEHVPKGITSEEWMQVPAALRRVILDRVSLKGRK